MITALNAFKDMKVKRLIKFNKIKEANKQQTVWLLYKSLNALVKYTNT